MATNTKNPKLVYKFKEEGGTISGPSKRMQEEANKHYAGEFLLLTIERLKDPKTFEQLKGFHGELLHQVKKCLEEQDGISKPKDKIKRNLKEQFLGYEKEYYSDGTPVVVKIPHPDKKGVFCEWHKESLPSLADLTKERMSNFIEEIIEHFLHERGWPIVIDPDKKK